MEKARYWVGVLYPENMSSDWKDTIGDSLEVPYAYCVHDKDVCDDGSPRKTHVHLLLAFSNTTTYAHALQVFQRMTADGCPQCISACKSVISIRHMYDYLIHDTEEARKKGKHLYDASERICGNAFDIGAYEQLSADEKNDMALELCMEIRKENFMNFADFFDYVMATYDKSYFEIVRTYSGLFERLTKGNYQRWLVDAECQRKEEVASMVEQSQEAVPDVDADEKFDD